MLGVLDAERVRNKFFLFAYVVMPTHLHLLFEPGECGLTANLRDFKSKHFFSPNTEIITAQSGNPVFSMRSAAGQKTSTRNSTTFT
jgi:hypothetical protein